MSTPDHDGNATPGWSDFRAKIAAPNSPKPRGLTVETRHEYEQQGKGKLRDGRKARHTGRTVKMTLKVKPAFKAKLAALANAREVGMAEILETAIAKLEADRA